MCCPIGDKGYASSRIDEVRKIARQFTGLRKFQYNHTTQELRNEEEVGVAEGDNNEPVAFETVKQAGVQHVIFVTDGGADNPKKALKAAKGLKIDIFYIGPEPIPQFLVDLAKQTGGTFDPKVSLIKELASNIKQRLLIDAPKKKKGPITL
jgi:hypothetical protein